MGRTSEEGIERVTFMRDLVQSTWRETVESLRKIEAPSPEEATWLSRGARGAIKKRSWAWDFAMAIGRTFLGDHVSLEDPADLALGCWTITDFEWARTETGLWKTTGVQGLTSWDFPCSLIVLSTAASDRLPDPMVVAASKLLAARLVIHPLRMA